MEYRNRGHRLDRVAMKYSKEWPQIMFEVPKRRYKPLSDKSHTPCGSIRKFQIKLYLNRAEYEFIVKYKLPHYVSLSNYLRHLVYKDAHKHRGVKEMYAKYQSPYKRFVEGENGKS